jgi:hypothetical protein
LGDRGSGLLREGVSADVWSVTSWTELRRDGLKALKHNFLYPEEEPLMPYVTTKLAEAEGPIIASSDHISDVPDQIRQFLPNPFATLGADEQGFSDTRPAARRYFHIDTHSMWYARCRCWLTLIRSTPKRQARPPSAIGCWMSRPGVQEPPEASRCHQAHPDGAGWLYIQLPIDNSLGSSPAEHGKEGSPQDEQVKGEGPVLDVAEIEAERVLTAEVRASADLPEPR